MKPAIPAKPMVQIVNVNQHPMVNRGVMRVRVRSHRRGRIVVRGISSTFDGRGVMRPFTRVAQPRFRRAGQWRVFNLRLTAASRLQAATCQDRDIAVRAGPSFSRPKSMVRQSADCRPEPVDLSRAASCNFIAAQEDGFCLSPFPDNFHTVADSTTDTGRRVSFSAAAMPGNGSGVPIDPAADQGNDGFRYDQTISVRVPGLDNAFALAQTNPVDLADPSQYLAPNAPVVVINALTRERHPVWVELGPDASSPDSTSLLIHPLFDFAPATRYIVALRDLRDAAGTALKAPAGFRYYRDFLPTNRPRINGRRSLFEDVFRRLRAAEITRSNLYLAWDFTTAGD